MQRYVDVAWRQHAEPCHQGPADSDTTTAYVSIRFCVDEVGPPKRHATAERSQESPQEPRQSAVSPRGTHKQCETTPTNDQAKPEATNCFFPFPQVSESGRSSLIRMRSLVQIQVGPQRETPAHAGVLRFRRHQFYKATPGEECGPIPMPFRSDESTKVSPSSPDRGVGDRAKHSEHICEIFAR